MTSEEYATTQDQLMLLGNLVNTLDLAAFIEKAQHADTLGPMLDPTLWMKGGKNLSLVIDVARAAHRFQLAFQTLREKADLPKEPA